MVRNILAVVFIIIFLVELYLCAAGSSHRKKKKLRDWTEVKGKIKSIDKVQDELTKKTYKELTIKTEKGNTVYSKQSPMFCIYDVGEEVDLIEKEGVHRFIGNDRVHGQGVKETLLGTIPMLVLVLLAALISYLAHIWS
ncbi:MAG: hypothetical protein J5517_10135 [Eubacterium sp.]|nr:hypothetical protein [Eubacterium sp.]